MANTHIFKLNEPWFTLTKIGVKTCEGRLKRNKVSKIKAGDLIKYTYQCDGLRDFTTRVTSVRIYNTFQEMLVIETIEKCLPGVDTIEQGVKIYRDFYRPSDEVQHGVVAVRQEVVVVKENSS